MLLGGLLLTACSSSAVRGGALSQVDRDFLTQGYAIAAFTDAQSEIALAQAHNPEVRALAQRMMTETDRFEEAADRIAAETGIRKPNLLPADFRVRLYRLKLQGGLDFDRTFVLDQLEARQNALSQMQAELTNGSNPKVIDVARRAQPVLQRDIQSLQAIKQANGW